MPPNQSDKSDILQELLQAQQDVIATTREQAKFESEKAAAIREQNRIHEETLDLEREKNMRFERVTATMEQILQFVKSGQVDRTILKDDMAVLLQYVQFVLVPALLNQLSDKEKHNQEIQKIYKLAEKLGTAHSAVNFGDIHGDVDGIAGKDVRK